MSISAHSTGNSQCMRPKLVSETSEAVQTESGQLCYRSCLETSIGCPIISVIHRPFYALGDLFSLLTSAAYIMVIQFMSYSLLFMQSGLLQSLILNSIISDVFENCVSLSGAAFS